MKIKELIKLGINLNKATGYNSIGCYDTINKIKLAKIIPKIDEYISYLDKNEFNDFILIKDEDFIKTHSFFKGIIKNTSFFRDSQFLKILNDEKKKEAIRQRLVMIKMLITT
jgi:hypothetical protein